MENKNGHYWLNKLEPELKAEIIKEIKHHRSDAEWYLDQKAESLFLFLMGAFRWNETEKGFSYWEEIANMEIL